ncbi:hypothetical protein ACFL6C_10575 [Myxococcota bacterium]
MRLCLCVILLAETNACSLGGEARVVFENHLSSGAPLVAADQEGTQGNDTPQYLGIKIMGVTIKASADAPSGDPQTTEIYVNPECPDDGCDPAASLSQVQEYFDFTLSTEQLIAALNVQGRPVKTGNYGWVQVDWCPGGDGPTVKYRSPSMPAGETKEFRWNGCASGAVIDPPLTVEDGDLVVVSLGYDLTNVIVKQDSFDPCTANMHESCYHDPVNGQRYMVLYDLEFNPSATKGVDNH